MDKRQHKRHARRLKVRYGAVGFDSVGFTANLSSSGMFVVATSLPALDTRLHLEVTVGLHQLLYFEGQVMRQVEVPVALRQVMKAGFGVRFLSPGEVLVELMPNRPTDGRLTLRYPDPAAYANVLQHEFRRGGVFCWSTRTFAVGTTMPIDVEAAWSGAAASLEVRVMSSIPGPDGQVGLTLFFTDASRALPALEGLAAR